MVRYRLVVATWSVWLAAALSPGGTSAQDSAAPAAVKDYPDRPIRLVLPYPPGGNTDIVARTVGQRITENWGKPVVVDARGGGNGIIATEIVARSNPDGYTVFVGSTREVSVNPILLPKVPYDAEGDFAPVSMGTITPILVAAHPSFAVKSIKEVIAFAKSDPKALSYA